MVAKATWTDCRYTNQDEKRRPSGLIQKIVPIKNTLIHFCSNHPRLQPPFNPPFGIIFSIIFVKFTHFKTTHMFESSRGVFADAVRKCGS